LSGDSFVGEDVTCSVEDSFAGYACWRPRRRQISPGNSYPFIIQ